MEDVLADIRRAWEASPQEEPALEDAAYEALDRATALRRASAPASPEWAAARLGEGFARLFVARQMAQWGNRSYALQALEASLDALRDAAASLPSASIPSPEDVSVFRASLLEPWRAFQGEPDLTRIANLTMRGLRGV